MKRVLVIGSTGLVGTHLLDLLDEEFPKVEIIALTRRKVTGGGGNVIWEKVDFMAWNESLDECFIDIDAVFVAVGTTKAKTPDEAQYAFIDRDIPIRAAQSAVKHNVPYYAVVSSAGADASSSNFYLRTKGEMENGVRESGLKHIRIMRPGFLLGERNEFRLGERIGGWLMRLFSPLLPASLAKYRGIEARTVARAMLMGYFENPEISIHENAEIRRLSNQNP